MLHKVLGVLLFFSFTTLAFSQNSFTVKGVVYNAATLQPIENALITMGNSSTNTSISGTFSIKEVESMRYTLSISHQKYTSKTVTLKVSFKMNLIEVYLEEKTTALEEVKVTGKSKQRELQESAVVVQDISQEFLENNRENTLMQTLSKIPGVSTINIGSGQSKPVIRGLGFNRVAVVQNGIKHEAQQWGNDHGLEIDQYNIEHIQIIKGPASLVYGSDAIAGVVDIQPNKIPAPHSFGGEVNLLAETNNDLLGVSAGVKARKENWFYRSRLTYRDYADYKVPTDKINYENYIFHLHDNNLRNTAGREADASFSVGYLGDGIKSETTFSNVNAKNGFFANAHGLEVRTSDIDYDSSNRDIDLPFHKVNHFKITNNTSFSIKDHDFYVDAGYQYNVREEHSEPVPHGYMPTPSDSQERVFNKNTYTLNVKDSFKSISQHTMVMGLNLEYQNNNIGGWGFLIPEYNRFTVGAFAFDEIEINSNLHFLAGLRYDYGFVDTKAYFDWYPSTINNEDGSTSYVHLQRAQDKELNFGNISASAGVSYIHNNSTFKLNIGKSFRMPLANELASDGVNYHMYRYERGNLNLDPEESYQIDLDIAHTTKSFSVGLSPFVNFFENFIYLNPTSNYYETLQIYEYTQSEVFRVGGELRAQTTVLENLQLNASAEYVYSRQNSGPKKGFTIPFSPPLSGLFSANYQFKNILFFKQPKLIAEYKIAAAQEEIVPPEEVTEGYQLLNMSLVTELALFKNNLPVKMRIKLNNVANTKYYDHTSFYRLIDVPEAGRNLSVSLTLPF
ncbi:iron complex outermembrane recepter protein [Mesonia phycicola]|uniref:Iron complex outermembrane recepter protein n=1 Tax=Mesonia phycicola TaxID=579105 RepID=A0A1M6FA61_9FLAO|nr:TonB-dependent receptor [Mesonia phycicola]SHI94553.1 iron complex outermembrane recepter protein [Mesonia phycicola]